MKTRMHPLSSFSGQKTALHSSSFSTVSAGCTHSASCPKAAARSSSWRLRAAAATLLDLGLLRNLQCVIDLDPEVPDGALQLILPGTGQQSLPCGGQPCDRTAAPMVIQETQAAGSGYRTLP